MSRIVKVKPRWLGGIVFWFGSDHYSLWQAIRRAPFEVPVDGIQKVYEIKSRPLIGIQEPARYAVQYQSEHRECLITLQELPEALREIKKKEISPVGLFHLFFKAAVREPGSLLIPFLLPISLCLWLLLFGLWDDLVVHNPNVLALMAKPGCDEVCVSKVLSIHSLVALLFVVQISFLVLPVALYYFQAPRFRSALNFRLIQGYTISIVTIGVFIFLQLVAFFPFKQYGRFLEMGFDPKVERVLSNLKSKK